jgi:hypothetical protein
MIADDTDRLCSAADGTWANPGRLSQATEGGARMQSSGPPSVRAGMGSHQSSASPLLFGAELLELRPHRRKPALEDADDPVANLGRRERGSVYESTPTIDLIFGTDDHLIGHCDTQRQAARSPRSAASGHRWSWLNLHWRPGGRVYFPRSVWTAWCVRLTGRASVSPCAQMLERFSTSTALSISSSDIMPTTRDAATWSIRPANGRSRFDRNSGGGGSSDFGETGDAPDCCAK